MERILLQNNFQRKLKFCLINLVCGWLARASLLCSLYAYIITLIWFSYPTLFGFYYNKIRLLERKTITFTPVSYTHLIQHSSRSLPPTLRKNKNTHKQ